jgi:hypothetical protein
LRAVANRAVFVAVLGLRDFHRRATSGCGRLNATLTQSAQCDPVSVSGATQLRLHRLQLQIPISAVFTSNG